MVGQNLFGKSVYLGGADTCIFISHNKQDKIIARAIAEALLSMSLNVYFDEYDKCLQQITSLESDSATVKCIEDGLDHSTHLLGIITNNTKNSWWVPYEIGGATGRKKQCAHLVSSDVRELPSFIKVGKLILDQDDLLKWAKEISKLIILEEAMTKSYSYSNLNAALPKIRSLSSTTYPLKFF